MGYLSIILQFLFNNETNVFSSSTSNPATTESPKKIIFFVFKHLFLTETLSPNDPILTASRTATSPFEAAKEYFRVEEGLG